MSALSPKLRKIGHNTIAFWCPGCNSEHHISIGRNGWPWNENYDRPTFALFIKERGTFFCHYEIRNGKIEYLSDCTHGLRGMTVDLPNWPFLEESNLMENIQIDL